MEGLFILIFILFAFTFGTPILFIILGIVKRRKSPAASKNFFILAVLWLIIGGGICASIMNS